jgi:hypothetical protein
MTEPEHEQEKRCAELRAECLARLEDVPDENLPELLRMIVLIRLGLWPTVYLN